MTKNFKSRYFEDYNLDETINHSVPRTITSGDVSLYLATTGSRFSFNYSKDFAEKLGLKPHKEDVGQTLGAYGIGSGCYFVLPILGPTTVRDSFGMIADTFLDPFAHVTIREKELFGTSGSALDYYSVKATDVIDFRADNEKNFNSLEKNSLDLYSSFKSIYLQDRENKIRNSFEDQDEWGNLEN